MHPHLTSENVDSRAEDIYQAIRDLNKSRSMYVNIQYFDGPVPAVEVKIFGTPDEVLKTFTKGKKKRVQG